MKEPFFSIITTAKNERNKKMLKETFENWELTSQLFEEKTGKQVEFIFVDAGGNVKKPELTNLTIVNEDLYRKYKLDLYKQKIIKTLEWDSPDIGRNLGTQYAKGKILVYQDVDSLFSTGTEEDLKYVTSLDEYRNFFDVMRNSFRKKKIVGAAPSLRPRDSKNLGRRFGCMGMNCLTYFSTKIPSIDLGSTVLGASVPGCSFAVLHDTILKLCTSINGIKTGPYDPELAIGEDHKFSREITKYGKVSYEKRAGVFIRTINRVSSGYDLIKSLLYAIIWLPYYLFPEKHRYETHSLRIK